MPEDKTENTEYFNGIKPPGESRVTFTLPQLLAVIVVVSILLAIVFPYLASIRETARMTDCANRLRETTLASHNYSDAHRRMPTVISATGAVNELDWYDPTHKVYRWNFQYTSPTGQILSFMELGSLSELTDPIAMNTKRNLTDFVDSNGNQIYSRFTDVFGYWDVVALDIPHYTCPSDQINEAEALVICAVQPTHRGDLASQTEDYFSAMMFHWPNLSKDGRSKMMGRTNYLGCSGANSGGRNRTGQHPQLIGCVGPREKRTLDKIPDGAANVIMFGETLGEIEYDPSTRSYERRYVHSFFTGGMARGRGTIPLFQNPGKNQQILGTAKSASWTGFSSAHPRGVNFTFADGSNHLMRRDVDWRILYSLCSENGSW